MKLSARNQLKGTVVKIEKGAVTSLVTIEIAPDVLVTSSITNHAVDELNLEVGAQAYAVVKASSVMVGTDD